jgi:16S rRNA processing protein RimM
VADAGWALLAHLVRPQGRHGEILAEILTDFPDLFAERKRLYLLAPESGSAPAPQSQFPREITLERHWLHKGRIVFKFAGIDSIGEADTLRGLDVAIPASERAPLEEGAVYISDLVGCEIFDLSGSSEKSIGRVADVDRAASLLVLDGPNHAEVLIPFAQAYLEKIDLAAKRIEMRLPAGLLDINAPLSKEERRALEAEASEDLSHGRSD